jgi:hypothetical protein
MRKLPWSTLLFAAILVLFLLYAARFIERTSFVLDGERYFVLFDDAMISMTYARNLAAGHGPVWNPGERVEGFTNPGWVAFMTLFHLLPLPLSQISLLIQISAAIFLAANLFVVRALARHITQNEGLALAVVFLTAFFFSLNNWSLQGMEVSLLVLVTSLATLLAVRVLSNRQFSRSLYLLLGLATWVRLDMAVPALVIALLLAYFNTSNRRKHLLWGLGGLAVFLGVQFLARYAYYGEWLPNTYYLKVGGISLLTRVQIGLVVLMKFFWSAGWPLFLVPSAVLLLHPERRTVLLLALVLGQAAYSIYVGGDAWEHRGGANRFLAIVSPQFFVLYVYGLELIRQALVRSGPLPSRVTAPASQALLAGLVLVSLFSFNTILTNDAVEKWTLQKRPIFVLGSERITQIGLAVRSVTEPEATVAVVSAGSILYFSERLGIDLYGKMDPVIARTPPRPPKGLTDLADIRPGHAKWDYAYSIGTLQPDLIAQLVDETLAEAAPYLDSQYRRIEVDGFPFYVRLGSEQILWDEIE